MTAAIADAPTDPIVDRHPLLILTLIAVAARCATFGNPLIHVDENFYFTAAHQMWAGDIPFVDIWDRKPVGLFLLYMLPAALPFFWGILAYQLLALMSVIATAHVIGRIAVLCGWRRGATFAGILYILWLNAAGGQGGQSPVFYNLPMAVAAWLVIANTSNRWRIDASAMALVGVALQIKYSAVFEGLFFGLAVLERNWRAGRSIASIGIVAVSLAFVALAPTAIAAAYYNAIGQFDAFLFANFWSIFDRTNDPFLERLGNFAALAFVLSPLVAMAFGSRRQAVGGSPKARRFAFHWFAAALTGILLFGGWYEHYALPAMVPGSLCAAGFLGRMRGRKFVLPAILIAAAIIGQTIVILNRAGRGTPAQFAALTKAIGPGPGCLFLYSGPTTLYPATGRCHLSRYLFPSHLYRTREAKAVGIDQATEVRRILAARPTVIVMRPLSIGERSDIREIALRAVHSSYVQSATLPLGNEELTVFKLRARLTASALPAPHNRP